MTEELNRKALYELVWSKPMGTIAKEYGLSDRGLAKLCERHSIPVPPRGYWAKKAAGKQVEKSPLITLEDSEPETAILLRKAEPVAAVIEASEEKEPALPATIQEAIDRERLPENQLKVPATMHNPHTIIGNWIKMEKREAELDRTYGKTIWLSPITPLDRRKRRIMSALFKALEARGFTIVEEGRNHYSKELWIRYERDKVSFQMVERIKQYRRKLTDEEIKEKNRFYPSTQKWTQVKEPTGKLEITLAPGEYSYSKIKIQEDDSRPFEDMLNEVVIKIIEVMWDAKSRRLKKEEDEKGRREEEYQRYLRQQAAEDEQKRKLNLEKKALAWRRAQAIREYIIAVEEVRKKGQLQTDEIEFNSWRVWAMAHADTIDFIANGNPLISLSEDPEDIDVGDDEDTGPSYSGGYNPAQSWYPGKKWYHR